MRLAVCTCTQRHLLKRHISSLNIFIWGVALCSHAACKNFAGLFACRLILGICEGSITAGFMIVSSMFYTRREQTVRVGYWCEDFNQPHCISPSYPLTVLMNGTGLETCLLTLTNSHKCCSPNYLCFHQLWLLAHTHHRI